MSLAHRLYFNRLAAGWNVNKLEEEALIAYLREFGIAADDRVLDVGCGTGRLAAAVNRLLRGQDQYVAVDFAEEMLKMAKGQKNPGHYVCADACQLCFPAAVFDKIICFSTFPHIIAPLAALREMHRVLKVGGRLLIWHTCCSRQLNAFHAQLNGVVASDRLPRVQELAAMLRQASFKNIQVIEHPQLYWAEAEK